MLQIENCLTSTEMNPMYMAIIAGQLRGVNECNKLRTYLKNEDY